MLDGIKTGPLIMADEDGKLENEWKISPSR